MIVDFHAHIFPPAIAEGAVRILKQNILKYSGFEPTAHTDATAEGLSASMRKVGIDLSVTLPIATKPSQTESINAYAKSISRDGIVSFGSLHPENEDIEGILEHLAEQGFRGIKLHPEFQCFEVDSRESIRIVKKAEALGLYTVFHAGDDLGMPKPVHGTPRGFANLLSEVSGRYIVAAHMGGFRMWEDVEKYLVGSAILLDTSFVSGYLAPADACRMIRAHGVDKILFGSDSPWGDQGEALDYVRSLGLDTEQERAVLGGNAARLLGLGGSHDMP